MPVLLALLPILTTWLPRIFGAMMAAAPAIAAVSIMAISLSAGFVGIYTARVALEAVMNSYGGRFWCALSACGGTQLLFWYITGLTAALSYVVAKKVAEATSAATARIGDALSKP